MFFRKLWVGFPHGPAAILLLAALVLGAAAALRSAEYDEGYTIFLAAGNARPDWPVGPFLAGPAVLAATKGGSSLGGIVADLRRGDVHPPLYFWAVSGWRAVVGESLFATRLFSVLCAVAALALVGVIARACAVPPAPAMFFTLGCYGFAYTGAIARGFSLALLLGLGGVALALRAARLARPCWALGAGLALGAASFSNYLVIFLAVAVCGWLVLHRAWLLLLGTMLGLLPFLAMDGVFFLAQRASRTEQFPPFDFLAGLTRLAHYMAATVLGGLPLYAGNARFTLASALAAFCLVLVALVLWHRPHTLPLLGAAAPPAGLLVLGFLFDNTPIELRYLAFATPFVGILLSGAIAALPPRPGRLVFALLVAVQAGAIAGLISRPETMQPQAAAAREVALLAGANGIALVPRGNDGVGVAGVFLLAAAPGLRVQLVPAVPDLRDPPYPRVVLVLLALDRESRAASAAMAAAFADRPCWRHAVSGAHAHAYDNVCLREPAGSIGWRAG